MFLIDYCVKYVSYRVAILSEVYAVVTCLVSLKWINTTQEKQVVLNVPVKHLLRLHISHFSEKSIYCPNKKDGYGWTGEMACVDDHMKGCEISCSKCKQIVHFSIMRSHVDTECPCYCPYCDTTAEREVISSEHKKCCKFPITCPNNCGLDHIPRDDMDEHRKVCPLQMIQCQYQCGAVIAHNEIIQHDRLNLVTHMFTALRMSWTELRQVYSTVVLKLKQMLLLCYQVFLKN